MKHILPNLLLMILAIIFTPGPTLQTTAMTMDNPFSGTWKANLAKSQRHQIHQFESATMKFEVLADLVTLTYTGVNMAGETESGTTKLHPDGKEHAIAEAPGVIEVTKWVDSHTLETVAKKEGKVVGQSRYEVSLDGKTLTAKVTGKDGSGMEFGQVIVFDRQ